MSKLHSALWSRYPEIAQMIKTEYINDESRDFGNTLNWFLCKFQSFTSVEQLRKTLGAGADALDFKKEIDTDTVTLIDLASPVIGTIPARIVGTLQMMKLWNAALTRQDRKKTHLVVIDEASLFQTNPMPKMLAESRKFGISMILCHQHSGQLTSEIRDALEANSANFSAFRLSARDAENSSIKFDNPEMRFSLTRLNVFNAVTTLSVDGILTAPFTLKAERPRPQKNGEELALKIEERSRETLVKPFDDYRALTSIQIQQYLNEPFKLERQRPEWFKEFMKRKGKNNGLF